VELNERMSIVPEFERESNERFTEHYRAFILEWDNSYYMVASFALFVLLLAAVSQMDRLDITAIMEGEEYVEEMLDIFIEDTTEELSGMRDAFSMRNYVKLGSIIHKAAPLWEMIRINIPRSELKGMASMPPEKWGGISDERIEKLIEAVEQAVEKVKK
jgi:hypothetical protein